jgi:hypothetical protein
MESDLLFFMVVFLLVLCILQRCLFHCGVLVKCALMASVCTSIITDEGPVWPKHVVSLHASMDQMVIRPMICEVALKTVLHINIL